MTKQNKNFTEKNKFRRIFDEKNKKVSGFYKNRVAEMKLVEKTMATCDKKWFYSGAFLCLLLVGCIPLGEPAKMATTTPIPNITIYSVAENLTMTNISISKIDYYDHYTSNSGYNSNDITSINYALGVDIGIFDTGSLNVDASAGTINGTISVKTNNTLDFESPQDANADNIYELINVIVTNNDDTAFSLVLQFEVTNAVE